MHVTKHGTCVHFVRRYGAMFALLLLQSRVGCFSPYERPVSPILIKKHLGLIGDESGDHVTMHLLVRYLPDIASLGPSATALGFMRLAHVDQERQELVKSTCLEARAFR